MDYTLFALSLTAWFSPLLLPDYNFDPYEGSWKHVRTADHHAEVSIKEALESRFDTTSEYLVADEKSLNSLFERQKREALTIVSLKLGESIYLDSEHIEAFSSKIVPILAMIVETNPGEEKAATMLNDALKEYTDKYVAQAVVDMIFKPDRASSLWHKINELDSDVQFFYVAKNRLTSPINLQSATAQRTPCRAC